MTIKEPAPRPCESCPYRVDVPSGVWDASEYRLLPEYDKPTHEQPHGVFLCHQQNGRVCAGWAGCHDMRENLGLRIVVAFGQMSTRVAAAVRAYESPVPLFGSGSEACEHGLEDLEEPGWPARRVIDKIKQRRGGEEDG